jgi:hypothetical protein
MNVDPEILKRLDTLAARLGVTADNLWAVLVKQASVQMWSVLLEIVLTGTLLCVLIWLCYRFACKAQSVGYDGDGWVVAAMLTGVAAVVFAVILITDLTSLPTLLLNPRYWALKEILGVLK